MNDAKVACRQLGFTKTVGPSWYGQGTGKVWLTNMGCSGSESLLGSCPHAGWGSVDSYCNGHTRDADVITVGYWYYGRGTGKVWLDDMECSGSEPSLGSCSHGGWGTVDYRCKGHTWDVVYHSGQWGTVCDYYGYNFDMRDAKVACRQLGYSKTVGYWYNGRGTGKVWLQSMQCTGSESSLGSCTHSGWGSVSSSCNGHTYDVDRETKRRMKDDRKTDGRELLWPEIAMMNHLSTSAFVHRVIPVARTEWNSGFGGVIQVYHSAQWGTVCDGYSGYYFDMNDAKVACRQLGFTKTVGYWYYGRGTGKVWLYRMGCTGSESSLGSCTHSGWGSVSSSCNGHTYDVGVVF
ncbi:soluble scavenger receptor cysteine-rich domain-containing protein SSC5D-like [Actinia tenebrosa]|uniref:Soluble scavenger receptor cysteine-rich domain-containing protein SSC5D-like n=1 Tax=Actinia tenebrosa TaxID=6105 RepID=A0A6P8IVR3_ACTTE|nr:soluble scavenger receptor cysteine-rich domain-containing protein SSC5D-like [Actinia tenebrosa]